MHKNFTDNVSRIADRNVIRLHHDSTVQQSLDEIRSHGLGERIVYFYVVDESDRLVGVLPTRRLLTADVNTRLSELMIRNVVTISPETSILEAHDIMGKHRLLGLPIVDGQRRIVGSIDAVTLTGEEFDISEREQISDVFETIGLRVLQVRDASPFRAFRFRFPWLMATIASGVMCAVLASRYETTLLESIALSFFITLVLGLGESVSMQSMTVTIRILHSMTPTIGWYTKAVKREVLTSLLLGTACAASVAVFVLIWSGEALTGLAIGSSIFLALCAASFFGLSIPTLLHVLRLDPKIAAGPMTLGITDICTLLIYFSLGESML